MKTFLPIIFMLSLILGCKSPSKLVEQGDYDKAIERSIKKMLKGNAKDDDKLMLDKAYKLANKEDKDAIKLLKVEGNPENWENIYYRYNRLDNRQRQVAKVLPFQIKGKSCAYEQVDYSSLIVEAKTKAADYYYAHGQKLMQLGTKQGFRSAYADFNKAKNYRESAFPDIYDLIEEARYRGTSHVLVEASNYTNINFSDDYYADLMSFDQSVYDEFWINYYQERNENDVNFDYIINIELEKTIFSPERIESREIVREKRIRDGFIYEFDGRGNVKKDSIGNDIKKPRYKFIRCRLIQRFQSKEVTVEARVKYLQESPRQILKSELVSGSSVFEHVTARAVGDIKALLPEDLELLNNQPIPFPDDISMLYECIVPLREAIEDVMQENQDLID